MDGAGRRVSVAMATGALLITDVAGCAIIDQFSPRAIDYNFQTADTKSGTVLLNILRAAYAQSLQFTDVSTVSAQATISAVPSASLPVAATHAAPARTFTVTPSGTLSGNNTVNVANLNNQEFYYGLQSPLKTQQIASYVVGNYNIDPLLLFLVVISDIEVDHGGTKAILHNRPDNRAGFFAFYTAMKTLVDNGLTVAPSPKKSATKIGPELTPDEAKDPKLLSALIAAAGASSASSTDSGSGSGGITLVPAKKDSEGNPLSYQLQKGGGGGDFNFCFRRASTPAVARERGIGFSVASASSTHGLTFSLGTAFGTRVRTH